MKKYWLFLVLVLVLLSACSVQEEQVTRVAQDEVVKKTVLCGPFPDYRDDGIEVNISVDLNGSELKKVIWEGINPYGGAGVYFDYNYGVDNMVEDVNKRREFNCSGEGIRIVCGYGGDKEGDCKYVNG